MKNIVTAFVLLAISAPPAIASQAHVIPYAGSIDLNGTPISGSAILNFALFDCTAQAGACSGSSTQLWEAFGSGAFPPAAATGVDVHPNGGKFSVLLGDDGQLALPGTVFSTSLLFVKVAVKDSGGAWVPLTGFQRIAPNFAAVEAEQAKNFVVSGTLSVAGSTTLAGVTTGTLTAGTLTAGTLTTTGNISSGANNISSTGIVSAGALTSSGNTTVGGILTTNNSLQVNGNAAVTGTLGITGITTVGEVSVLSQVELNDHRLLLRGGGDSNHALEHRGSFGGVTLDGPALYGFGGGVLGTNQSGTEHAALSWDSGGVTVPGNFDVNGTYEKSNQQLFITCSHLETVTRGGGAQSFTFSAGDCGGTLPDSNYVGMVSTLDVCSGFDTVNLNTVPTVNWFVNGTGCSNGGYRYIIVYLRK